MNMRASTHQESGHRIELCEAIQNNSNLFTIDTSVVLVRAFTRRACLRTITLTLQPHSSLHLVIQILNRDFHA